MSISIVEDHWLSAAQVAQILGIKKGTLDNRRSQGKSGPPYHKSGKYVRYNASEFEAWLAKHRFVPAETQLAEAS